MHLPRHRYSEKKDGTYRSLHSRITNLWDKAQGWQFGVLFCACSTSLVFILNLAVTAWSLSHYRLSEGQQVLFEGSCDKANNVNTALHFVINVFSTILLSSSNYCMQCLSAPTREEVDKAHAKRRWLDIGVLSTKNLFSISRKRAVAWCLLGASSVPLHLFYNSLIFSSITSNKFYPVEVTQSFANSSTFDPFRSIGGFMLNYSDSRHEWFNASEGDIEAIRLRELHANGSLEYLDNLACINAYAAEFPTRGNVMLVVENGTGSAVVTNTAIQDYCTDSPFFLTPGNWVCGCDMHGLHSCSLSNEIKTLRSNPSTWSPLGEKISHCWSEKLPERCTVQASLHIAVIVICLNFVKAIVMFGTAFGMKDTPLMTIGDAVESYIENPDPSTEGMCIVSRKRIASQEDSWPKEGNKFVSKKRLLFSSASGTRWAACFFLYATVLVIMIVLLKIGFYVVTRQYAGNAQTLRQLGIGKPSSMTLITLNLPRYGVNGLLSNAFLANVAQPILSFIYFMYNGIFTAIYGALEWESFARHRKGLRVSKKPRGDQRSSHFLELPYRISLPLMLLSGVLHWLVSQCIFLVNIDYQRYAINGWGRLESEFRCGFSLIPGIITVILAGLMIVGLYILGCERFKTDTPVVANCSAAIAAACHVPQAENKQETSTSKLQWGVTGYGRDEIGHCSFSASSVDPPEDGRIYQ